MRYNRLYFGIDVHRCQNTTFAKAVRPRPAFLAAAPVDIYSPSRAGRYTFVWRGTTEKSLEKVKAAIKKSVQITELYELRAYLEKKREGISFVYGSGKRKSEEQKKYEKLKEYLDRWEKYEAQLKRMGAFGLIKNDFAFRRFFPQAKRMSEQNCSSWRWASI